MKLLFAGLITILSQTLNAKTDYEFKLGHWQIEAQSMNPDKSHNKGYGYGYVYQNQVGLIQDNLCIDMNGVSDVIGTTLRTYDEKSKKWNVRWLAYGASSGIGAGIATNVNGSVVEAFEGKDTYGRFIDEMNFKIHSVDYYEANLSRTYLNGNIKIDCIWCYKAKRSKSKTDAVCDLTQKSDSDM